MTGAEWMAWRDAWQAALYGPTGFYRHEVPADHFRTSVHASPLFAEALVALARHHGLDAVTDVGAGQGELLTQIHRLAPDLRLAGVDVRPRPAHVPAAVGWREADDETTEPLAGLVVANELLDNVPCDIVELGSDGEVHVVEVRPQTGDERLGPVASAEQLAWLETWWPLGEPGDRAEVGLGRERFWATLCARVDGVALAIDYGHLREDRPRGGSLASYRNGRQTPVTLDGHHDVTAHVAFDSLVAATGGLLQSQSDALAELGLSGRRPPLELARSDPAGYVRALSRASQAAELMRHGSSGGSELGDFCWLTSR